jgi:hypothetical protein
MRFYFDVHHSGPTADTSTDVYQVADSLMHTASDKFGDNVDTAGRPDYVVRIAIGDAQPFPSNYATLLIAWMPDHSVEVWQKRARHDAERVAQLPDNSDLIPILTAHFDEFRGALDAS